MAVSTYDVSSDIFFLLCITCVYRHTYKSCIIIIISAERRPLLDIGIPQMSPQRPLPCFSYPAGARKAVCNTNTDFIRESNVRSPSQQPLRQLWLGTSMT